MNNPKPKIYNNDIKVLGRVVSIASENKVAAAEQIFDEKFKYNELPDYSFDNENIDPTQKGLNQYSINRLIGKKVKDIEEAGLLPDEDGFLSNIKIDNLTVKNGATFSGDVSFGDNVSIDKNLTVGNKITTKDLEVTNNAKINKLIVGPGEGIDVYEALTHLLQCCENINNQGGSGQGGVTLVVSPNPINMNVGDTIEFTVKLNASGVDLVVDPEINYTASISDTSVATLTGNNEVTAVSGGTTQLTVSWNGIQKTVQINVAAPAPTLYTVTYMDDTSIITTEDYEAGATIDPLHGQDPLTKEGYTFAGWSGMPSDMKMPANDITVIAQWTQNEQPVEPISPESISISGPNAVQVGNTITLTATIAPSNADTDTTITWSSSSESKATVNNGVVTGVAEGDVVITATTANGRTATHNVTVNPAPTQNPQSITITGAKALKVGTAATASDKTCTLVATISPTEADQSVTWSSSDDTKATVNNNGVVSAVSEGSVTVTATSTANPQVSGSVTINITLENTPEPTPMYTLTFDTAGGSSIASVQYYAGEIIESVAAPTKSGYDFTGWSPSIPAVMPANDLTVVAQWEQTQPAPRYTIRWTGEHFKMRKDDNFTPDYAWQDTDTQTQVNPLGHFDAHIILDEGYILSNVRVTMGSTDVTGSAIDVNDQTGTHIEMHGINDNVLIEVTTADELGDTYPLYIFSDQHSNVNNTGQISMPANAVAELPAGEIPVTSGEPGALVGREISNGYYMQKNSSFTREVHTYDKNSINNVKVYKRINGSWQEAESSQFEYDSSNEEYGYGIVTINSIDAPTILYVDTRSNIMKGYESGEEFEADILGHGPQSNWNSAFSGINLDKQDRMWDEFLYTLPTDLSQDEIDWIRQNGVQANQNWVHLEDIWSNGPSYAGAITFKVDPWTERINTLKSQALSNSVSNSYIVNEYGSDSDERTCTITITASDGTTKTCTLKQNSHYGMGVSLQQSDGGSNHSYRLTSHATAHDLWETVDVYGPSGTNVTYEGTYHWTEFDPNPTVHYFVARPYSTVNGVTQLPDCVITDGDGSLPSGYVLLDSKDQSEFWTIYDN